MDNLRPLYDRISKLAASEFKVDVAELDIAKNGRRNVNLARYATLLVLKRISGANYSQIARMRKRHRDVIRVTFRRAEWAEEDHTEFASSVKRIEDLAALENAAREAAE